MTAARTGYDRGPGAEEDPGSGEGNAVRILLRKCQPCLLTAPILLCLQAPMHPVPRLEASASSRPQPSCLPTLYASFSLLAEFSRLHSHIMCYS